MKILKILGNSPIKVTVQLKDLDETFFTGNSILKTVGLNNMSDRGKLDYLMKQSHSMSRNIKVKIGNGQFNTKVEFNRLLRDPNVKIEYSIVSRRGYKLVTFMVG